MHGDFLSGVYFASEIVAGLKIGNYRNRCFGEISNIRFLEKSITRASSLQINKAQRHSDFWSRRAKK